MRLSGLLVAGSLSVACASSGAIANLALTLNPNATISSLSAQLLKKPRSSAGNQKNCWDADPQVAAASGMHYFLYNIDANNNPLPSTSRVITLQNTAFGPGYSGTAQFLVQSTSNPSDTQFVKAEQTGFTVPLGYVEVGLAQITFTLGADAPGQIQESDDVEIAYDATDAQGQKSNVRGVEQARFVTEYLAHDPVADSRIARGMMTTTVPSSFNVFLPPGQQSFTPGFLNFGTVPQPGSGIAFDAGTSYLSSGTNVFSAVVQNPEPTTLLTAPVIAGIVAARRRK